MTSKRGEPSGCGALVAEAAGGLDQPVVGLGAGVGEEHLAGDAHVMGVDFLRQFRLLRDLIEIGNMQQFARLLADGGDHARVAVAERADGDAGAEIEVTFPGFIPQAAARAAHRDQRKAPVGGKNMLGKEFGGGHGIAGKGGG